MNKAIIFTYFFINLVTSMLLNHYSDIDKRLIYSIIKKNHQNDNFIFMKNVFVISMFIVFVILVSSCKKEQRMDNVERYNIPNKKTMSVFDDLLNKQAEVKWFVSSIRKGSFTTTVSQIFYLPEGTPVMVVNGEFNSRNNTVNYSDNTQPNFSILFLKNTEIHEVSAIKPYTPGENQAWNALSSASIGVYEDAFKIVITSNDMFAATENGVSMNVEITIWKVFK